MTWKGINALDTHITVAIDGPSGAGKSTIARAAARRFGLIYVDTGAIYRTVGLAGERAGVNCSDAGAMQALLPALRIELVYDAAGEQRMLLNGEDVSETIRLPEVSLLASRVSALPVVRAFLLDMQRSLARTHSVVMDGRDIGTVVLPDAGLKIFLSASAECRAQRRWRQLQEKGIQEPYADVLRELMRRAFDILDQHPINVARRAAGKLPANGVWFWAEGTAAALPNFPEHYGSDGGVVSAVPLCHGIGILTGLEAVTVPTATGEWDTDYAAKVAAALGVLKRHDFVALHLEGPDEATHNHDLEHKIYSIERLSADVVAPVTEALRAAGEDFRLLLLSDHTTYMANGAHGADPVPFVLYDSRVSEGSGLPYSEANGAKGPYVDDGAQLMDLLFELKKL